MPFHLPSTWPAPGDPDAAVRLAERFAALGAAAARAASRPAFAAMLAAIGGNSPYLADLALRESRALRLLARFGPDVLAEAALARLAALPPDLPRARLAASLRAAKRQVALATALADIGGIWPLERVTGTLSALAEAALAASVAHLLREAHARDGLRLPDPARPEQGCGFVVLGMGKLGARELNFSSDVDLFLLYDPAPHSYHADALRQLFARLARDLVSLMEARDADGYVFRTDLRLRPDPSATPPAIALPAALTYYEGMGQNWERAAMIKARPVAGDHALGARFLDAIRPFVWRRHLDFAAIADIDAMKRRMDAHKGTAVAPGADPVARVLGHNVKLGEGGIREIEFLAQTLQLVWGGRDPGLRDPTTRGALRLLVRAGRLPAAAETALAAAYDRLRRIEHRLQMVADRQTHTLPATVAELARFATFMGAASAEDFARDLLGTLAAVREHWRALFEHVPALDGAASPLDLGGPGEPPPATLAAIRALGFPQTARVVAAARSWLAGRPRALRSERAQVLLGELLPAILAALGRQPQPEAAFARFDAFLSRLPAGVQLLSLFQRNPALLARVVTVLGAAPSLADHLAHVPAALEGLLAPEDEGTALATELRDARLLEEALEIIRRFVRGGQFRASVAEMEGRLDPDAAAAARTGLADATIRALLPRVLSDFSARNGRVRGGGMAVVALGKAGGREMMEGSDLDLMLVYDHPEEVVESTGARRVPASQYFIRAAHAFVAALTAPGLEGPLFAVDMRLRPSGNKGPVAVSLGAFCRYHAESAWTWERMALTRARVVAGPRPLAARVSAAIAQALARPADPARIRADGVAMRARLARDLPPSGPWDVKHRAGGLIEVEFIAQVLQLAHAPADPSLCHANTRAALAALARGGALAEPDAALLIHADRIWRGMQGMLRLTVGRQLAETPPAAAMPALARAAGLAPDGVDVVSLRATLETLAAEVRRLFVRHLGDPETSA